MRSFPSKIAIGVGCVLSLAAAACSRSEKANPTASNASTAAPATPDAAPAPAVAGDSFPIPRESVDLVLNPKQLPPYDGPTGSVEGTVYVTGPAAPLVTVDAKKCPAAVDTYGKLFREGPALPNGSRPLADAAVVVVGYEGYYLPEREEAKKVAISAGCAYPTRTITMTFGQRLEVSNQSTTLFAPILDQDTLPAVMVAPPLEKGDPVKLYPRKAAYFTIGDRMQPFVHEDLYVFRHPLHTVTDVAGHYRIDGLPVGSLKVGVHHPGAGANGEAPVEVVANVVQHVDVTVTYAPKEQASAKRVDGGRKEPWLN
jgi:hypothetical protein